MSTWHLHIQGQVQGVGFRPFVHKLARRYQLSGWVNNGKNGVHIEFNAEKEAAVKFKDALLTEAPTLSIITAVQLQEVDKKFFDNFQIIHSEGAGIANLLMTPDFGICADCRAELHSEVDRRSAYPFITCTNCGPRFSIITRLPYDRRNTSMAPFAMCPTCKQEYEDPNDRRYYSQTNTCPDCPIDQKLINAEGQLISALNAEIISKVVEAWQEGKIVAIKGIGGFLLTCAAHHSIAIQTLRDRKHRPAKPLALMYPSMDALKDFAITETTRNLLENPQAPIVLLDRPKGSKLPTNIAPGLEQLGVMLPYTPLYELLLKDFGKPIIATSGNISNAGIIYENDKAARELSNIADLILLNNRDIVLPQDDSVIRISPFYEKKILLRRSRGLAPTFLSAPLEKVTDGVFAAGAQLKSTFAILHRKNIYISPYLGDLDHFATQESYQKSKAHFTQMLGTITRTILCDAHPNYSAARLAAQWSNEENAELQKIQHHKAHFGAILGEHSLLETNDSVLGVIWDGTGYGDDGQIWGGEYFIYDNYHSRRVAYINYFPNILGEKMAKEPRISGLSLCINHPEALRLLQDKFTATEWPIYRKLLSNDPPLRTSSMGRLFDAIAAILGVLDRQRFEGEAAMKLEALATKYCKVQGLNFDSYYKCTLGQDGSIRTDTLIDGILEDLNKGESVAKIAAKFHFSLVRNIRQVAQKHQIKKIACSGGVFQNALLVDLIIDQLSPEFELFFHEQLAPNDENISFGQLMCYQIEAYRTTNKQSKNINHVFSHSR